MKLYFIIILFYSSLLLSCKKYLDIPPPENEVITETVFIDDESALSAVSGLYSQLLSSNNSFANGGMSLYASLSSDDIIPTTTPTEVIQFASNTLLSSNSIVDVLWQRAYKYIYHCNAVIEGLGKSVSVSSEVKSQLTGEVKFVRAFCYFYLVQLYGDVPMVLSTAYEINSIMPRTKKEEVMGQVISDLVQSKSLLNINYPSAGRVRPNKSAAAAMLARVYLFNKDWVNASASATEVITNTVYNLPTDLNTVFISNSTEAIWQLLPVLSSYNSSEGFAFIPSTSSSRPSYILTGELLNSFAAADKRKLNWSKTVTVSGQTYTYPFKYKVRSGSAKTEYNMVLRLAEQYLIRAEAKAELNELVECQNDINKVRQRAGLSAVTATTKDELLDAILQERRGEFFAEWGMRWIDLKRKNIATNILLTVKPDWQPYAILYPIPFSQLTKNPALVQNDGY